MVSINSCDQRSQKNQHFLNLLSSAVIGIVSFLIFRNASEDFSYDYINYISYIDRLSEMSWVDLYASLREIFPYPYIFVPPAGLWEIGFALPIRLAGELTGDSNLVYSLAGAGSVSIRIYVMRSMGVKWLWVVAINIGAITLFEANAIRLGWGYTIVLLGMWWFVSDRPRMGTMCLLVAGLFHLQTLSYSVVFLLAYWFFRTFAANRARLLTSILCLGVIAWVLSIGLHTFDLAKLGAYSNEISGSAGITSLSVLGLLALFIAAGNLLWQSKKEYSVLTLDVRVRVWVATVVSIVPAIALLFLATSMGALGDRLWQFSFLVFSAMAFTSWGHRAKKRWIFISINLCMLMLLVNIIIRYPLSNFFYPIVPYTTITPLFLLP